MRVCSRCRQALEAENLSAPESDGLESERKAAGLHGVRFRYYTCPSCNHHQICVDVRPLRGESARQLKQRRDELESVIRDVQSDEVALVLS